MILFKEQTELLGNFLHLSDSPDRIECCGLMPFFLISRTVRILSMTAKESEQEEKGKFPLVTFVKLQATLKSLERLLFFYFMIFRFFVDMVIKW